MSESGPSPQQGEHPLFQELWERIDTYVNETDSGDMRPLVHELLENYSIQVCDTEQEVGAGSLRSQVVEGMASSAGSVLDGDYFARLRGGAPAPEG